MDNKQELQLLYRGLISSEEWFAYLHSLNADIKRLNITMSQHIDNNEYEDAGKVRAVIKYIQGTKERVEKALGELTKEVNNGR